MFRKFKMLVSALILGVFIVSACGGGAAPSGGDQHPPSTLAIAQQYWHPRAYPSDFSQGFRQYTADPVDAQGFATIKGANTMNSDRVYVKIEGSNYLWKRVENPVGKAPIRVQGVDFFPLSLENMVEAHRIQYGVLGFDPSQITVDFVERSFITTDYGVDGLFYMSHYGTEQRVYLFRDALIQHDLAVYRAGFARLDVSFDNGNIDLATGRVAAADLEFGALRGNGSYPDMYPFRNEGEYKSYLEASYAEDVDVALNSGALPDKPADDPSGPVPQPSAMKELPDYVNSNDQLKAGELFRGNYLMESTIPGWTVCYKDCGMRWRMTLVRVEADGLYWGKTYPSLREANNALTFWQKQLEIHGWSPLSMATVEDLGNGMWLTRSPDVGLGWEYYWARRSYSPEYQLLIQKGIEMYKQLYLRGVACPYEIACQQWAVGSDGKVWLVDADNVVIADGSGKFPDEIGDLDQYMSKVHRAIGLEIGGDHPMIATEAPVVPDVEVPNPAPASGKGTIPVQVLDYEGKPYQLYLTEAEYAMLKTPEAANLLASKNVKMPPPAWYKTGLPFVGKSLVWSLNALGIYYSVVQIFETTGVGGSIQLSASPMETQNFSETANQNVYNFTQAGFFPNSPLLSQYEVSHETITYTFMGNRMPTECGVLRLDDDSVTTLGIVSDPDVPTPLQICPREGGYQLTSLLDGSSVLVTQSADATWMLSGTTVMTFESPITNGSGNFYISPIRAWVDSWGLHIMPTWQELTQ